MAKSTKYVPVYRSHDQISVDLLCDVLRDQDIPVRLLSRPHAALIGLGHYAAEAGLDVPAEYEANAREVIEAFLQSDGEQALRNAGIEVDSDDSDGSRERNEPEEVTLPHVRIVRDR